ncbi:hypothetical protein FOA52_009537 [Chlamydomonas sp. UWO 241]|nr:hypothetical protein FOA52_009537 [Chlamydomonas sp. UWO 241]
MASPRQPDANGAQYDASLDQAIAMVAEALMADQQAGAGGADAQGDIGRFLDALTHDGLLPPSPTLQRQYAHAHAHAQSSPLRQGTHSAVAAAPVMMVPAGQPLAQLRQGAAMTMVPVTQQAGGARHPPVGAMLAGGWGAAMAALMNASAGGSAGAMTSMIPCGVQLINP